MTDMAVLDHDDDRWLELLSAHADGELGPDDASRVADHLTTCAGCEALEARFADDRRRARLGMPHDHGALGARILVDARAGATPMAADAGGGHLGRRLAAAAVVVAAAGLATVLATRAPDPAPVGQLSQRSVLLDDDRTALAAGDVVVPAGTTVRLRNSGDEAHHLEVEVDGTTETTDVVPGAADAVTYDEAGTYAYRCTIHPEVAGTVTVEA